ncbi:hypothetical protein DPMN_174168 [Dreissena polymorpha]|uniref:Uncharacterized protein n=1 Tax=Dreissena polymorpha TaxID=45954 RepID=A0A9D4IEX0_DREPO|nr:hypothetical protein DPMN_174168 [Dreissena polymorpha]
MLDLYKSFVLPVLTYGIEIFTPNSTLIKQLDLFQRKTIKQILSLPNNAADPCVLILTGLLPIEALYHLKILNFFNNICGQKESSIERQIVVRQLSVKSGKSSSWNLLESMDLTKQVTSPALLAQTLIDWSIIVPNHPSYRDKTLMLEFHIRRLFFHLHTTRYRLYKELSGN